MLDGIERELEDSQTLLDRSVPDLKMPANLKFGPFSVASQVFHLSPSRLTYALVNLKPLLPGHVLVCPTRCTPRLSRLSQSENADLFATVQQVSRMVERVFEASSLNIAVQDGVDAGQSVPHVHVHIIPRNAGDLEHLGGGDKIYDLMDGDEGNVGDAFLKMQQLRGQRVDHRAFSGGPDADRVPRREEEMRKEAAWLRSEMDKESITKSQDR